MLDYRIRSVPIIIFGIILLCQLPSLKTEKVQKSSNKFKTSLPVRTIVPLSSSDLLAAHETGPLYDGKVKRTVRKLENDGQGEDAALDAVNTDEYMGVVGKPGIDFPVYSSIPVTNFSCRKLKTPGYYADLETNCQVFHICDGGRKISFLCPNGTIFQQSQLICDWWFRVDCGSSPNLYEESAEQLAIDQKSYKAKAAEKSNQSGNPDGRDQEDNKKKPKERTNSATNTQDNYNSRTKASGNQPLQQNTFASQGNRSQKKYNNYDNNQAQASEIVTPAPNNIYSQNRHHESSFNSDDDISFDNFSGNSFTVKPINRINPRTKPPVTNVNPSDSKVYSGGNSLDESQVLAESVNYGTGKQNRYNQENNYKTDVTAKQFNAYQPSTIYPQDSTIQQNSQVQQQSNNYVQNSPIQQANNFGQANNYVQGSTVQQNPGYSTIQQAGNYQQYSTVQQNTNFPQSTTIQQSTTYQQNSNAPLSSTVQQGTNYPQVSTIQQNTNYPQSTTIQQNTNYPQSTTYQQSTNYQENLQTANYQQPISNLQSTTYQQAVSNPQTTTYQQAVSNPQTTTYQQAVTNPQATTYQQSVSNSQSANYQQGTTATLSQSDSAVKSSPNYVSNASPETATPVYSTIKGSTPSYTAYSTIKDSGYPSTYQYNPSTSSPELLSNLNFNRISLDQQANLVPEAANSAGEENPNSLDSISIYYDQINNKESVRLPISNFDSKKISVSDIFLKQDGEAPSASFDVSNSLPSVLTDSTKEGYTFLFSNGTNDISAIKENNQYDNDLATLQNQGILQGLSSTIAPYASASTTTTTLAPPPTVTESEKDLELRHSSDLRELAQVFSRALSAYLEDPENFRRILSEVRPTEPNIKSSTANPYKNEVLEFSEDNKISPDNYRGISPQTTPAYTTLKEEYTSSSIANQVNNLVQDVASAYFPAPKNLYGGFQNNSLLNTASPYTNVYEGTTQTYYSVSPLVDVTRAPEVYRSSSTPSPAPASVSNYQSSPAQTPASNYQNSPAQASVSSYQTSPAQASVSSYQTSQTQPAVSTYRGSSPTPASVTSYQSASAQTPVSNYRESSPAPASVSSYQSSPAQTPVQSYQTSPAQTPVSSYQSSPAQASVSSYQSSQTQPAVSTYRGSSPTPASVSSYQDSTKAIGAQDVNNLVPSRSLFEDYDKNNVFSSDKYDYSFGANAKKTTQELDEHESLIPYDSQSFVSRDNLLKFQEVQNESLRRFQEAQQKYYDTLKSIYQAQKETSAQNNERARITYTQSSPQKIISDPSGTADYYYNNERVVSQSNGIPSSTYSNVEYAQTESPQYSPSPQYYASPSPSAQYYSPTASATPSAAANQYEDTGSMYKEAKEIFGNLNETSANMLMDVMHEAESNTTLRRLVLLLVNDKTGKKTPEETRNKLLEALLQMPQRVPSYPQNSIRSTYTPKVPRRVKVLKSRTLATNEKSSTKYQRDTSAKTANIQDALLPDKLSSESDTRAVELLKSLYVLAAKWG